MNRPGAWFGALLVFGALVFAIAAFAHTRGLVATFGMALVGGCVVVAVLFAIGLAVTKDE